MSSELEFKDKVVIITGSSGGFGSQIALDFIKNGAQVVITGRNEEKLNSVAEECDKLSPLGLNACKVVADVTNDEDIRRIIDTTIGTFGKLDILINNAGAGSSATIYDERLIDDLEHMFKLDVRSVVLLTQLAVPHLEKSPSPAIVNISSVASIRAVINFLV